MDTIITNKYPVTDEEFKTIIYKKITPQVSAFLAQIISLVKEMKEIGSTKQLLHMCGRDLVLDLKLKVILPELTNNYKAMVTTDLNVYLTEDLLKKESLIPNAVSELPTLTQLRAIKGLLMEVYDRDSYFACIWMIRNF